MAKNPTKDKYSTNIKSVSTQRTLLDNGNYSNVFEQASVDDVDGFRQYYKQSTPGSFIHYAGSPEFKEQLRVNNSYISDPFLTNFLYNRAGYQATQKKNGGLVYNWIPEYPRTGAKYAQGGWLEKYANGGTIEDQKIPTPTTPSYYPAYPDRTLTTRQMGTPKAPMYAAGATVWTKQDTPLWATPTSTQANYKNSRAISPESAIPYPEVTYPKSARYFTQAPVMQGYNPYNGPMRLHAPDTTRMEQGGRVTPDYKKRAGIPYAISPGISDAGMYVGPTTQRGITFEDGGETSQQETPQQYAYRTIAPTGFLDPKNYYRYATGTSRATTNIPMRSADELAWKKYLGLNQNEDFPKSKAKPTKSTNKSATYYTLNPEDNDELLQLLSVKMKNMPDTSFVINENDVTKKYAGASINPFSVLQDFTVSKKTDDKGTYISYYDKYDFDRAIEPIRSKLESLGTPYEFYNKYYYPNIKDKYGKTLKYGDPEYNEYYGPSNAIKYFQPKAPSKKAQGGPIYNWIPNYPRVGAKYADGGDTTNARESTYVKPAYKQQLVDPNNPVKVAEALMKKYNVTIDSTGNMLKDIGLPSDAYYNPMTRTINYKNPSYFPKDWQDEKYARIIATELPHAVQADSLGTIPFLYKVAKEGLNLKTGTYSTPGTIENEAHSILEPKFKRIVFNTPVYSPMLHKMRKNSVEKKAMGGRVNFNNNKKQSGGWLDNL
jgi:hypothetical protein